MFLVLISSDHLLPTKHRSAHSDSKSSFNLSNKVLIDDRADDCTKDKAKNQWDLLNPCCARPGLARTLRQQQICSGDLSHGYESGLLKGLACSARITVADCELRHARNRTFTSSNGRTGYASFCVSSILDESKLLHTHALAAAQSRDCVKNVSGLSLLEQFCFVQSRPYPTGHHTNYLSDRTHYITAC